MTSSVSAGHIILTPTQPVGSARLQRGLNPGPPQESRALPMESDVSYRFHWWKLRYYQIHTFQLLLIVRLRTCCFAWFHLSYCWPCLIFHDMGLSKIAFLYIVFFFKVFKKFTHITRLCIIIVASNVIDKMKRQPKSYQNRRSNMPLEEVASLLNILDLRKLRIMINAWATLKLLEAQWKHWTL